MTVILLFVIAMLGIAIFPMLIPFLLLSYMALNGLASRQLIYHDLKMTVGGVNIFPPDILYAASFVLAVVGMSHLLLTGRFRMYAPLTKAAVVLVMCYFVLFMGKFVSGYLAGVPADSLVRRFALDTQCVYMFVPLFYLKRGAPLRYLLYFVVLLSLLFPLAQPFLYGSHDQVSIEAGLGGTLRLGFGNANLLLMLGMLALLVWEKKLWLSAIPLSGIAMLAQRSAFISIALCIMVIALQKKKSIKFIALMGMAGIAFIIALMVIKTTSSVPVIGKATERLSQTFEKTGSTKARMDLIPVALGEYEKRPFVGFTYHEIHSLKQKQGSDVFSFNMLHPHNFVLSSLLRSGTIGTLLLLSIIFVIMMAAFKLYRKQFTKEEGMYLFSAILFFVVFGLMNTSFVSAGYVFWVLAGITLWYLNYARELEYQQRRSM